MKKKTFTPSYEETDERAYFSRVKKCEPFAGIEDWGGRPAGCKRTLHKMIEGGREELRDPGEYQRKKEVDPKEWAEKKEQLAERLDEFPDWIKEHPQAAAELAWEWRTQWPDPTYREKGGRPSLRKEIEAALKRYRERGRGTALHVPDTPYGLIDAGMPPKAAWILVNRAAGKVYPVVSSQIAQGLPEMSLLDKLESQAGAVLKFGGNSGRQLLFPAKKGLGVLEDSAVVVDGRRRILPASWWETKKDERIEEIRRSEGRSYRAENDDPPLLRSLFRTLSTLASKKKGVETPFSFYFSGRKQPFVIRLLDREHSKLGDATALDPKKGYKTLNVSLRQLPKLLASLTRRKKHEGRRLQARTNPVNDDALIQLIKTHQKAAIQAELAGRSEQEVVGHLVSVPGESNRVYWWSGTKKQLVKTTPQRAKSWIGVAVAGKDTSKLLHKYAEQADHRLGLRPHTSKENQMARRKKKGTKKERQYMWASGEAQSYNARQNAGNGQAATAMQLFHSGQAPSLKAAWSMVKAHARNNPWYFGRGQGGGPRGSNLYLPDTTVVPGAFVPAEHPWDDETEVFSALVPGPYAKRNRGRKRGSASALQNGEVRIARNGTPYIILPSGKARFISKAQAAHMNPRPGLRRSESWGGKRMDWSPSPAKWGARPYDPLHDEWQGQFSTGVARTSGTQPYARRNNTSREDIYEFFHEAPAKRSKKRKSKKRK